MSLISLDLVINAIVGIINPTELIRSKLQRNEIVIKLLQQFDLAPGHPPADFSGVYAYTLVEYGVGKPKPFLELFRQTEIKTAFRKAFEHNNPSIVLLEVEAFLNAYALGDEIRILRVDVKREVAAFATIFIEVAKRSRTPAEVLTNQQIGSLHTKIVSIHEQLERLPTLESIRTEMARLAAAETGEIQDKKCQAIALAQQIQGWFETLGYRFEKYAVWENSYFELIVNIPVRRNRYDRILVRGIEGEAGLLDVAALRESVAAQKTDEGWLVASRRISRAARDEVDKEENRHLDCYTFDELIDQDADFSGYLDWLEAQVKSRDIEKKYVPLACSKEEFDPVTKRRIAVSRYEERDGWIDGYIDLWLDDPAKEHISVLGEFGTGKTWFAFHYAWTALQRYRDAQRRGIERPRLPLVITLRDYAKALNVENVLAGFFFTQHNIRLNSEVFDQLNRMGKLLLIFDGFDEMAAKCDRQQMINNFWELAKVVVPGAKVILTCRTEHFPEAREGRALLNAELQASTANLTGETPQFEVLELEKFNDEQIRQVLSFQAEAATVKQVMGNPQLLDLARRPVMTELILEALPDIEAGKPVDMSRVYLYAVRRKIERDIKAERTFTSLADKLYFLCELSWEMLSTDQMSVNYRLFPDRIRRLFGAVVQEEKDLDHWHYDMMGQTMLIRNASGDYTPAHRSLLEFFVAYKFAAELGALADDFTELSQAQSCLNPTVSQDYTWSGYFSRQVDENGQSVAIAPLKTFTSESLTQLRQTFGQAPLTKAVMDLLVPMLSKDITDILQATRGKTEAEVGYIGGNAATLLVKADKTALEGKDLSQAVIKGADFSSASLCRVNFTAANLTTSIFPKVLGAVFSVAYSPDGQVFATGDANCQVNLWLAGNGQQILNCKGHRDWVRSVVFSTDGKTLISASYDRTIKLWNVSTGECLKTLLGHTSRINSVAISPDGTTLATGSHDTTVKLWDIRTGECLKTLQGHTRWVHSVAISPDGITLASGSQDTTIKLWDIRTGECLKTLQGHTHRVSSVVISSNATTLVSCGADKTIKLWDIHTGECLKILYGHAHTVRSVAIGSDGTTLGSSSMDKTVKLWNIQSGECLKTLQGHTDWVRSVTFSPDCNTIITGSDDQTVRQWDVLTGESVNILHGYIGAVRSVVISPNGKTLVSSSEEQIIRFWNIQTGKCFKSLQAHFSRVNSVAISADGNTLATSSYDRTIKLWNIHSGECLKTLQGHTGGVKSIAIDSNAVKIVSSGGDKTIKIWNMVTGECLKTLQGHTDWISSVAISPDGTKIASGSTDNMVKLWDSCTGQNLTTLQGHTNGVNSIAISPDGTKLVSASNDETVKLWNIQTGECLMTLRGHISDVLSVVFSPNGKTIAKLLCF